jgi:phosphoribosylglycinamide formyltransferase 1
MKRIVVLISGRGSNLRAIAACCAAQHWPAQIAAVVCNRPEGEGLAWARETGLPTTVVDHRAHASRDAFDAALAEAVEAHAPDLLVLAGFMRVLGDAFVQRYAGRMLNVHPSLLPAFAGLHTHRRALAAGCKLHGATVHFVTPALDHGPIVIQAAVPVRPDDDEATLAARVQGVEHVIYPLAVRWFVEERLRIEPGPEPGAEGAWVRQLDGASQLFI